MILERTETGEGGGAATERATRQTLAAEVANRLKRPFWECYIGGFCAQENDPVLKKRVKSHIRAAGDLPAPSGGTSSNNEVGDDTPAPSRGTDMKQEEKPSPKIGRSTDLRHRFG